MNKIFTILFSIVISSAIIGCAPKTPEPVSTWHRVIEFDAEVPND